MFSRVDDFYKAIIIYYRNNMDPDVTILEHDWNNDIELEEEEEDTSVYI